MINGETVLQLGKLGAMYAAIRVIGWLVDVVWQKWRTMDR